MSDKKRSTVYVVADVWKKFRELCEKEGTSASQKIEEWVLQYVREHYPGNPQLTIPRFIPEIAHRESRLLYMEIACPRCGGFHKVTLECPGGSK